MELRKLQEPFPASDIEWRIGQAGESNGKIWATALAYLTSRAVMDRLDQVCGPDNWRNEYREWQGKGVLCGISIKVGDEWVTKWDGAENTAIESIKGGLSDAMKRAAVQWGIGRYLYNLPNAYATIAADDNRQANKGSFKAKSGDTKYFRWLPPSLPAWALPSQPKA